MTWVVVGLVVLPLSTRAGEREVCEAPLYAAAVSYVADRFKCSANHPCCYSVGKQVPSADLVRLLKAQRRLKPIGARGACPEWTIDIGRVRPDGSRDQYVASAVGGEGSPIFFCTHLLRLTSKGWVVDPKRDMCPVT